MIEIFFTCWLVLMPNGDLFCYCEGEDPPPVVTQPAHDLSPILTTDLDETTLFRN